MPATRSLLIRNVTLIDGTGATPAERVSIRAEDGVISSVDADHEANVDDAADEVVEGHGLWAVPGFSLHMELGFLSGAGLSNMDVIRAATSRAAEALWRDDLGTVQPGKRADILLLRADPLADLAALRNIQHVVRDGRVFDPVDLFAEARGTTS